MQYLNNTIAVTYQELTRRDDGEPVISISNYRNLQLRKQIIIIRPGKGLGHPALIEWASLPTRFKERFILKYGDPEAMLNKGEEMLKYDQQAREFFAEYILENGSRIKEDKQTEYIINASVLNRLIEMSQLQHTQRRMKNNTTPVNWEPIYEECKKLRGEYGHTLPKSNARLRDRIRQYKAEGYVCLISGKLTNDNAIKITPAAGRQIIALKRCRVPVLNTAQIFEEFNRIAEGKGWKPLKSISSLQQFLDRPEIMIQWKDTEQGELKAKMMYSRQNATILPSCRDAIWYGDGTKINIYYKAYINGKYQAASAQVFEVVDAYSEAFIGYHISDRENFETMYEAYRKAIESTGHLPVELIYDNQGGTKREDAKMWLAKISICSRPTAPYNAPSKTIESIFGRFQAQVLHKLWFYTGANIQAKKDSSKINAEFLLENVDNLPTYSEMLQIYAECREQWNNMPHYKYDKPRMQLYLESANPQAVQLTDTLKRELFWMTTAKPSTFTAKGIQITIEKRKYVYEVLDEDGMPDMKWRSRNTGREFWVQYDPHDMSVVRLCTKDQYGLRFETEARPYITVHRAMMEQKEGERSFLKLQELANKKERIRRQILNHQLELEHGVAPEQFGLNSPSLLGIKNSEYERLAEEVMREMEMEEMGTVPVMANTLGQIQKQQSNFDAISAYDKM